MSSAQHDLRVALDMTLAVIGMTGVQRYVDILHEGLRERPGIDVRSFAFGRGVRRFRQIGHRYPVPVRVAHRAWATTSRPRAETLVRGADVVHALGGAPPPTRRPLVVTIHDLLPLTRPELFTERSREEAAVIAASVDRAEVVVTTCDATADEIHEVTGMPRERIVVAPLGPREKPRPRARRPKTAEPYLLVLGAITPRKGLEGLAAAVALLGPDAPHVVAAGPDGHRAEEVRAAVRRVDVHERFRFVGPVEDDAVTELIDGALVVCHPSLAEGFGMVVLEAMACGAPVVATALPSVREIAGDAAVLIPTDDPEAMAVALSALLGDDGRRERLGDAAVARARDYSWERFVDDIVSAYELAASV